MITEDIYLSRVLMHAVL